MADAGDATGEEESDVTDFWIFVDIGKDPGTRPSYFVVPAWWTENSIYEEHRAYLARHGGKRAQSPASKHHAIPAGKLEDWRERWYLLDIF